MSQDHSETARDDVVAHLKSWAGSLMKANAGSNRPGLGQGLGLGLKPGAGWLTIRHAFSTNKQTWRRVSRGSIISSI
jgi:hypothetical protein